MLSHTSHQGATSLYLQKILNNFILSRAHRDLNLPEPEKDRMVGVGWKYLVVSESPILGPPTDKPLI